MAKNILPTIKSYNKAIVATIKGMLLLLLILSFAQGTSQKSSLPIIPQPVSMEPINSNFKWDQNTLIVFEPHSRENSQVITQILNEYYQGFDVMSADRKSFGHEPKNENTVHFIIDQSIAHEEGYSLTINEKGIICKGRTATGWFYGWQSLKQLFPLAFFDNDVILKIPFEIKGVKIIDYPRFEYRGMHLDVCRHFFSVEEVKKYIDLLAMHKMNRFHWHLTEDQGWRIEIKKYPKLTEIGGFRNETLIGHYSDQPHQFDGTRYGGYYTQEEIKEVIRYAQERQVTIIPEIEMPGHSKAALAAYPELACTPGPFEVATKWGIFEDVYCTKDQTFEFLEDVLKEVADLFPGEYIHIGGDECPKTRWKSCPDCQSLIQKEGLKDEYELQSYFITRIEKVLAKFGKKLIGWDEILEGGLSPGATVMSWRGTKGGIEAAKMDHDVIMTPGSHCYFDHYQSDHPDEPIAIGGYTPLEKVYSYEPVPDELSLEESKYVLGAQANVWTEYIKTFDHVEYMAYPRASALSEVLWSPKDQKDYKRFSQKLFSHLDRLELLGVDFAPHLTDVKMSVNTKPGESIRLILEKGIENGTIRYAIGDTLNVENSDIYDGPLEITTSGDYKAAIFDGNEQIGRCSDISFIMHKGVSSPVRLTFAPSESYNSGGTVALVNGVYGSDKRYGDKEWLGFSGNDFEAVIDLGSPKKISSVSTRFYHGPGQWIYFPKSMEIFGGPAPDRLKKLAYKTLSAGKDYRAIPVDINFDETELQFIKVIARNYGEIPEGKQGAGHNAWLFVDEMVIR